MKKVRLATLIDLLDNLLDYTEYKVEEDVSEYAWNSITIKFFADETEEERTTKMEVVSIIRKLLELSPKMKMQTLLFNGEYHYIYDDGSTYGTYDIIIKQCEE